MPAQFARAPKKTPPKNREQPKPKKKLDEACQEIKERLAEERRLKIEEDRQRRDKEEADAVMEQIYGPNWRTG